MMFLRIPTPLLVSNAVPCVFSSSGIVPLAETSWAFSSRKAWQVSRKATPLISLGISSNSLEILSVVTRGDPQLSLSRTTGRLQTFTASLNNQHVRQLLTAISRSEVTDSFVERTRTAKSDPCDNSKANLKIYSSIQKRCFSPRINSCLPTGAGVASTVSPTELDATTSNSSPSLRTTVRPLRPVKKT